MKIYTNELPFSFIASTLIPGVRLDLYQQFYHVGHLNQLLGELMFSLCKNKTFVRMFGMLILFRNN